MFNNITIPVSKGWLWYRQSPVDIGYVQLNVAIWMYRDKRSPPGRRSFSVAGPAVWNSLPDVLRDQGYTVSTFKQWLKTSSRASLACRAHCRYYDDTLYKFTFHHHHHRLYNSLQYRANVMLCAIIALCAECTFMCVKMDLGPLDSESVGNFWQQNSEFVVFKLE